MDKIKQLGIISVLFLCCCCQAQAQRYFSDPEYNLFTGGLVGGINFCQIDGDSYKGYDKSGITAGGILFMPFGTDMGLPIPGTLALSMEILFNQKGSYGGMNPGYGIFSQKINLYYGDVPVMINWYRGTRKSIIGAGFSVGFLGFREEYLDRGHGPELVKKNDFNYVDLSFVLSPTIHIWKGFHINPRFQYSLIPIRSNDGGIGNKNQFNNVVSVRLMYLFSRAGGSKR
ncbi:MAG: hypothetical protein BGO09_15370 [Bacteroidetes bacterium 47-18]|nr:MAG: hypothetical protein BGO09_15370 [Bacteroidetes bacterium 47-18]